jgi:hypothetical protein
LIDISTAAVKIAKIIATIPGVVDEFGSYTAISGYGSSDLKQKNLAEAVSAMRPVSMLVAHVSTDLPAGASPWSHTFTCIIRMNSNEDALRVARKIVTGNPEDSNNPFLLTTLIDGCDPPTAVSINTSATQADGIEYAQLTFQLPDIT